MPNAATWWCGGEAERAFVQDNFENLVISSAFRRPVPGLGDGHTRAGASFSAEERAALDAGMALRPMDYTAQEIVQLSTTPALAGGHLEARGFTLRAFLARDEDGEWSVLQGGFGRVSEQGNLRTTLMGLGDISTDVCIIEPTPAKPPEAVLKTAARDIRREQGVLPSQAADNLYWLGRYSERTQQTARSVRVLVEQGAMSGERASETGAVGSTTVTRLGKLLTHLGAIKRPGKDTRFLDMASQALGDTGPMGSVRNLIQREQRIAQTLRDRLSRDSWRALQRTMPAFTPGDGDSIALACDRVIERHATVSWLLSDGMSRGPEWQFLNMGMGIERASMILQAAQAIIPGSASADDLSALLELVDCQSLYRSRYLTMPYIPRVYDMVLLEPAQPRGLVFQVRKIEKNLTTLPDQRTDGMPEAPLHAARQLRAKIEGLDATKIGPMTLEDLRKDLAALSEAISNRYFLQVDAANDVRTQRLFCCATRCAM